MKTACSVALLLLLTLWSCSTREGGDPIPAAKFADVYLDLLKAAGKRPDSTGVPAVSTPDSILHAWGVTPGDVRRTVEYYNRNPEKWRAFFSDVIRRSAMPEEGEDADRPGIVPR